MGDNYEWELSKENIQPLKHGRNISSLVTALTVNEDHHRQQRNEQRKQMELAIMAYEGSDPLDLWNRYILWVEENYPQGGKEGDLLTILEKCLEKLRDCEQYKSDHRLLDVYLRYLDLTENNAEWFQQLYGAGYFHKLASFYVHWADCHEMSSNFKEGTKVYQLGLHSKAEPYAKLDEAYRHYQARVASAVFKNMTNAEPQEPQEPSRNAFGELETDRKAPALRIGSQVRRAPFQNRVLPGPKMANNKPLFIHQDDENAPVSQAPLVSSKAAIPIHSVMKAENNMKASKWTESHGVVNEIVASAPQPAFQVHVDDEAPPSHKKATDGFSVALKDKAAPAVKLNPQTLFERDNPKMKMMCDLNKILVANREFSFEEIRRQIYEKNGRQAPLSCSKKTDRVRTPSGAKNKNVVLAPPPLKPNEKWHCAIDALYQDGQEFTFEHLRARCHRIPKKEPVDDKVTQQLSTLTISPVKHVSEPVVEKNDENVELAVQKPDTRDASVQTDLFGLDYDVVLVPRKKPEVPQIVVRTPSPEKVDSGPNSGQPSPTVNTKQALSSVKSWFNSSVLVPESRPVEPKPVKKSLFAIFKDPSVVDEPDDKPAEVFKKPFAIFSDCEPIKEEPQPKGFAVFDENAPVDKENAQPKLKLRKPLVAIDPAPCKEEEPVREEEDDDLKENAPPKGFVQETVKRQLSGILVPSVDIPCDPAGLVGQEVEEEPAAVLGVPSSNARRHLFVNDAIGQEQPVNAVLETRSLGPPRALFNDDDDQTRCYFAPMAPIEDFTVPSAVAFANNLHIQSTPLVSRTQVISEEATFNLPGRKAIQPTVQPAHHHPRGLSPIDEGSREYYSSSGSSAGTTGLASHHSRLSVGRSLHDAGRIYPAHFDPFDLEHRSGQLTQLAVPLDQRDGFNAMAGKSPWLRSNSGVQLGRDHYVVKSVIGQGAYAKIFDAYTSEGDHCVLKVQESDGIWEFYISSELQKRLAGAPTANSVLKVERGYFYETGSILVNQYLGHGTLLDLVNHYRLRNSSMPEPLVYHFTMQLLALVRDMHECGILHADIKADNVMLQVPAKSLIVQPDEWTASDVLREDAATLKLIDLGRSLDLALYPDRTSFMHVFQDDKCPEMRDGKSWSYQLDYYGIATTIFTLLMGVHCKIVYVDSQWRVPNLKRSHNAVWRDLTTALLNAPSNGQLDLLHFRQVLADQLVSTVKFREYNDRVRELERYLVHKQ